MLRAGLRNKRPRMSSEDVNPMEGAINIVDAMLVFSCGLMLSLVIYWNIDIKRDTIPTIDGMVATEVRSAGDETEDIPSSEDDYMKVGSVYVDPVTGKMYLVDESAEGSDANADE